MRTLTRLGLIYNVHVRLQRYDESIREKRKSGKCGRWPILVVFPKIRRLFKHFSAERPTFPQRHEIFSAKSSETAEKLSYANKKSAEKTKKSRWTMLKSIYLIIAFCGKIGSRNSRLRHKSATLLPLAGSYAFQKIQSVLDL